MTDTLVYSRNLHIATGSKRTTKVWQNRESEWRDIVKSLQRVSYTGETVAQYHDMGKREKDERKDVGGLRRRLPGGRPQAHAEGQAPQYVDA